jgi:guanylate kinase
MSLGFDSWSAPDTGALFVITGSSGTGKTTLVQEALATIPGVCFSVSATTRAIRSTEQDGVDYHFHSKQSFEALVQTGQMLEWAEVYGNCYGTPRAPVLESLARGDSIVLDIDVQGAQQVRAAMPEAISVFVLPPSIDVLEARLRGRSTDSEEIIRSRMREAQVQIQRCNEFDYLVVNDDLESAHDQFQAILVAELCRRQRHSGLVDRFCR